MYLVLNAGSSSLKCKLFSSCFRPLLTGLIDAIGDASQPSNVKFSPELQPGTSVWADGSSSSNTSVPDFSAAFDIVNVALAQNIQEKTAIRAIAHRVVHGGPTFHSPVKICDEVLAAIEDMTALAPLHNPSNILGIRTAQEFFPTTPHIAVFDTAFHYHLPPASYLYAIPRTLYKEHSLRRYGFHGTSYWGLLESVSEHIGRPKESINMIAFHLGAGCSACCIENGTSVDHTMGLTPLEGLVMGTRPGDLDPGVIEMMYHYSGLQSWKELSKVLNKECGLKGLCGESDMRRILHTMNSAQEDPDKARECSEAVDVFVNRAQKYLGAYLYRLENKVDAIVFTGGVGENSPYIRQRICKGLDGFGIHLDSALNQAYDSKDGICSVSSRDSGSRIIVCPADEEASMAKQAASLLDRDPFES